MNIQAANQNLSRKTIALTLAVSVCASLAAFATILAPQSNAKDEMKDVMRDCLEKLEFSQQQKRDLMQWKQYNDKNNPSPQDKMQGLRSILTPNQWDRFEICVKAER